MQAQPHSKGLEMRVRFGVLLLALAVAPAWAAPPPTAASASARGRSLGRDTDERSPHIRLRLPPVLPGKAAKVSLALQVDENRGYRFEDRMPGALLDLGHLEHGWNPMRVVELRLFALDAHGKPVPVKERYACSTGFMAQQDGELQLVLSLEGRRLRCDVR